MEEHNWKSLLETTKTPKAPSGFKNDILKKIEKLPVAQHQSSSKGISLQMIIGIFLVIFTILSLEPFLPELNGLDVFDGVKSSFLEVKTVYMILGTLVFWSSIDYYFSAE
tara:strand:- start:44 stop:373 length:330 start_codon:yes stop_codon:yes gene_type:complete